MCSFLSEVSRAKRAIVGTLFKLGTYYITEELLNLNHFELYIFFPSLYAVYLFSVYLKNLYFHVLEGRAWCKR